MERQEARAGGTGHEHASGVDEFGRTEETNNWRPLDFGKFSHEQRAACQELLRRGDISWFLHPEQNRLVKWIDETESNRLVINICRQLGKSFGMLAYCIAHCIANPGVHVVYLAPSKDQVKRIVMPNINTVFSFLPDDLLPVKLGNHWTFRHNLSTLQINGCNIGAGTRLRGIPAHLVVIDECRDVTELEDIIDSSVTPMFTTTNGRLILISTPPESPLHAFTDKYIREAIEADYYYTTTYKNNPLLSKEKIISLLTKEYPGGEDNAKFRREYMADYSIADPDKRVVREWNEDENDEWFATYIGPPEPVRPYTFLDYGYTDPSGILFGYFDWKETILVIEDEFLKTQCITDDIAEAIKAKEKELHARLPVLRDETGKIEITRVMDIDPSLMRDLYERHALRFRAVNKLPNDHAMINKLRHAFVEGRIRVHPRCKNLKFQLKAGVWNKNKTDYLKSEKGGHLDLVAALKYGNLSVNWKELLRPEQAQPGQQTITIPRHPFKQSTFGGGLMHRPVQ